MKLEGDYLFEASVPEVWSALFDPVILAAVMPGCEKLELVDGQYVGEIKVKVGPIQGKFTGKVDLKDKDEPRSYTMIVDGRGAPGFVKATAAVRLAPEGEATRVSYDTDAQIGGKIASVGQRLIEASARAIVAQSLEGLHTNIKLRAAAYREAAATQAATAGNGASGADATTAASGTPSSGVPAATSTVIAPSDTATPPEPATSLGAGEADPGDAKGGDAATAAEAGNSADTAKSADAAKPAEAARAVEAARAIEAAKPVEAAKPGDATPSAESTGLPAAAAVVAFTPVKVKQSDLANAVAKEVASSLFPRSVLVAIILLQALVIVWLLLRH